MLSCWRYLATVRRAMEVGGQAVLGRQAELSTPWLTERHGYDPTSFFQNTLDFAD